MKHFTFYIFTFLLILCVSSPLVAQDKEPLLENIRTVISASLPKYSLKNDLDNKLFDNQAFGYIWTFEKSSVFIWLEFGDSVSDARGIFASQVWVAKSHGFDVKVPDERLSNLGFDNYWSEDVPNGKRGLHFYRGKVAALVNAPNNQMAEMIARQIDVLLPDK